MTGEASVGGGLLQSACSTPHFPTSLHTCRPYRPHTILPPTSSHFRFLEGLVKRLAAEVSARGGDDGGAEVREGQGHGERDESGGEGMRMMLPRRWTWRPQRRAMIARSRFNHNVDVAQVDVSALMAGAGGVDSDDGGAGLPGWLRDRRYLNPLLAAYDERIAGFEGQLRERSAGLEALQRQVRTYRNPGQKPEGEGAERT